MHTVEEIDALTNKNNRIDLPTRIVSAVVVPILVLAFIILYLFPSQTAQRFAWEIRPNMTAAFMGAGYLGGAWLFFRALIGRRWHRVAPGFLPVTAFTWAMLLVTALHWSRFDLGHFPFLLWLGLYVATPFLVPWLWLRNRAADPGLPEEDDLVAPLWARRGLRFLGFVMLLAALAGLVVPDILVRLWPWSLTPLTARVLGGWFALLATGGLVISRETRWSAWRAGLQAIGLWQVLILMAAPFNQADFSGGLANWYLASVALVVAGMIALYAQMERKRGALRWTWNR